MPRRRLGDGKRRPLENAEPPLVAYRGWAPGRLTLWLLGFLAVTTALTAVHRTFWIATRHKPGP